MRMNKNHVDTSKACINVGKTIYIMVIPCRLSYIYTYQVYPKCTYLQLEREYGRSALPARVSSTTVHKRNNRKE